MLRRIKNKYNNPPVYILENGLATNGKIDDWIKIKSLYYHMQEMLNAKSRDGCNVKGFGIWSLLDSWEWLSGYRSLIIQFLLYLLFLNSFILILIN